MYNRDMSEHVIISTTRLVSTIISIYVNIIQYLYIFTQTGATAHSTDALLASQSVSSNPHLAPRFLEGLLSVKTDT